MNHKEKCEELRKIRVELAKDLGIEECIRKEPCTFNGECSGTCQACQIEEKILLDKLYELKESKEITIIKKTIKPEYEYATLGVPTIKPSDFAPLPGQILPRPSYFDEEPINYPPSNKSIEDANENSMKNENLDKEEKKELNILVFPEKHPKMGKTVKPPLIMGEINDIETKNESVFDEYLGKVKGLFRKKK